MKATEVWESVLRDLELRLPRSDFETWLQGTSIVAFEDGVVVVATPNSYARQWLTRRAGDLIRRTISNILGYSVQVRYVVAGDDKDRPLSSPAPKIPSPPVADPPSPTKSSADQQLSLIEQAAQARHILYRKGRQVDFPFEVFFNSYELYLSTKVLVKAPLYLSDVASHLWFCARFHQDYPWYSEYTFAEIAAVLFGDPAKYNSAKSMIKRLERMGLLERTMLPGRGNGFRIIPYLPLNWNDFILAVDQGLFDGCELKEGIKKGVPTQAQQNFDFEETRKRYKFYKPHNFQRDLVKRGWEPCLHSFFHFYVGMLLEVKYRDGQCYVTIPGKESLDIPWEAECPPGERTILRLTQQPLLDLDAITIALMMRKKASRKELSEENPLVDFSLNKVERQHRIGWRKVNSTLKALAQAGIICEKGVRRRPNEPNKEPSFQLWDPCEQIQTFLKEVLHGIMLKRGGLESEKIELSEFGRAVALQLGLLEDSDV